MLSSRERLDEIWRFNESGVMDSATATSSSKKTQEDYFVPIMSKTSISNDMLVIALEGSSLKNHLPDVRWGYPDGSFTTVPFTFQIFDYARVGSRYGWKLRQENTI